MCLDGPGGDGQAESCSAGVSIACRADAVEGEKYPFGFIGWNAKAVIALSTKKGAVTVKNE